MFGLFKFLLLIVKSFRQLLDPNINPLRHAPPYIRYFASVLLACFWCLAFGLYIGEQLTIGYNMFGHIAVVSMAFATWTVFKQVERTYGPREGTVDFLRMPDRSSRCDELTDEERQAKINEWNNRNIWNDPKLAYRDQLAQQLPKDKHYGS
jgi:hypothetical protein